VKVVFNNIALVIHKRDDDKCVWRRICVTIAVINVLIIDYFMEQGVLFALEDANFNFMFVDVSCQGRISDSVVFTNIELYKRLET